MKAATLCACLALLACMPAAQAGQAFIVGITTHLMNVERPVRQPLVLAAEAGFDSVKDDILWSTAAPDAHHLRIFPQWWRFISQTQTLHMSRLAILGYSTWFHNNAKPRTPEVIGPFLDYVDYVSRQLGNRVDFYEIWNEWDLESPHDPQLARDYAAIVKRTVPILRKNTQAAPGPKALVLAGAVTPEAMRHGFADHLIDSGALDLLDGLSIHPYAHCESNGGNTPEAWIRWVSRYEQHIRERAGRAVPIYITEMGWPSHTGTCGYSEATQALYMARMFFLARTLANVKGMWWYDLYNDGPDLHDQEHNFGVLNEDLSPKPAWTLMKAIAPVLRDYHYDAAHSVLSERLYQLYFEQGQTRVLVAWVMGPAREQQVVSQASLHGAVRLLDTARPELGEVDSDRTWRCENGRCTAPVLLSQYPRIIRLTP